jgi:hypothetical protein
MPLVSVRLSAEDIEALHRVASYLYESESDDYFDNDQPADHLYHSISRVASLAQFAELKMQPASTTTAEDTRRRQLSLI